MSELPDFIKNVSDYLRSVTSYSYFDYHLNSGRYFDQSLLFKGFSFIFARNKMNLTFLHNSRDYQFILKKGELLVFPEIYRIEINTIKCSFFKIFLSDLTLTFSNHIEGKIEIYERECHPNSKNKQHLVSLFIEFQKNYKKKSKISCFRTEALLKLLLADCLDMADGHENDLFEKDRRRKSYNKLINYLERNFHFAIDANRISKSLDFSVQYLNSLVNEFRNMSLKELVNFYRLEISREKLVKESIPIAVIASNCGFSGAPYFIKLFRKTYGITPLQCRKKLQVRDSRSNKNFHKVLNFKEIQPQEYVPTVVLESTAKVTMLIVNTQLKSIIISLLNSTGKEIEMYNLKLGQRLNIGTGFGEYWSIRNSSKDLIGHYCVPNTNCQIII